MNDLLEKVEIEDAFYIYLQRNSSVWLCRFKIGSKWISRTTKQREKAKGQAPEPDLQTPRQQAPWQTPHQTRTRAPGGHDAAPGCQPHRWVPAAVWDLVVTMDDATGEHTSMFFCHQEGTDSSFHGIGQTIEPANPG